MKCSIFTNRHESLQLDIYLMLKEQTFVPHYAHYNAIWMGHTNVSQQCELKEENRKLTSSDTSMYAPNLIKILIITLYPMHRGQHSAW